MDNARIAKIVELLRRRLADLPERLNILLQFSKDNAHPCTAILTQYSLSAESPEAEDAVWEVLDDLVNHLEVCAQEDVEPRSYAPEIYLDMFERGIRVSFQTSEDVHRKIHVRAASSEVIRATNEVVRAASKELVELADRLEIHQSMKEVA